MRHSHEVISRISARQRHHHRRRPAVQRERALQHQPLRPVGAERCVGLRRQHSDSTTRAFGTSCRATGAASLCSGRSRMFANTRSYGARLIISGACKPAACTAVTSAPTPFSPRVAACLRDRPRIDVGREHRHAEQLCGGDRQQRPSRCRDRGCGAAAGGARARPAPAGSLGWCRDDRCRMRSRPRSRCRSDAPHAVAVVRAVHDEAPGGDRPQSVRLSLTQSRGATFSTTHRARQLPPPASAIMARRLVSAGRLRKCMSTCQRLSGRSNAAHTTSAGSRLSARKSAIRRAAARRRRAGRRRSQVAFRFFCIFPGVGHSGLCTAAGPTSTGIINRIYTGLRTACGGPASRFFLQLSPKRSTAAYTSGD